MLCLKYRNRVRKHDVSGNNCINHANALMTADSDQDNQKNPVNLFFDQVIPDFIYH